MKTRIPSLREGYNGPNVLSIWSEDNDDVNGLDSAHHGRIDRNKSELM